MKEENVMIRVWQGNDVRIVDRDGEPWFVATDVCRCLGIGSTANATSGLDDYEKGVDSINTLGGMQELSIVSESGLYGIIMQSRKPAAKQFQRWIRQDVLPSIRKTGSYVNDPDCIVVRIGEDGHALVGNTNWADGAEGAMAYLCERKALDKCRNRLNREIQTRQAQLDGIGDVCSVAARAMDSDDIADVVGRFVPIQAPEGDVVCRRGSLVRRNSMGSVKRNLIRDTYVARLHKAIADRIIDDDLMKHVRGRVLDQNMCGTCPTRLEQEVYDKVQSGRIRIQSSILSHFARINA